MNPVIKQRWVEALRSGEYEQGKGFLKQNNKFCCLGVLCDLYVKDTEDEKVAFKTNPYMPTSPVLRWAGLEPDPSLSSNFIVTAIVYGKESRNSLNILNDEYNFDFQAIANLIEEQL